MNNMVNMVSMRHARIEDAPLVAWDLETATDRMFSFMLGARWEQILIRVVNTPGHAWSIENARIAEIEGKPVGVILSGPSAVPEPDEAFGLPWGWTRMRLSAVGFIFRPFLSLMRQHGAGAWHITAVSVVPDARGKGVGSAMISYAIEHARAAGMTSVTLDVDVHNAVARRLYEREGFEVHATSRTALLASAFFRISLFAGGVRVQRMRIDPISPLTSP
jgi:ribosomal protein S18 acetylase RimI-like enzyme